MRLSGAFCARLPAVAPVVQWTPGHRIVLIVQGIEQGFPKP